ncbi:hypothetical protein [Mesobacillus jeotgali]|uniref:hypothetical protein n=1 Tax=Mesobacillus jeotgali TaxID=129985 RepID=UPI0009A68746|nr:hypothetical protein [Mesobacillus jeotgali]
MPEWIVIFYPINFLSAYVLYIYLYQRRKHIGLHLGMKITMMAGGGLALGTGIIFINLYPSYFIEATLFSVIIGVISGILFGNLFDYKSLLNGYITGLIMGILAPIAGAWASGVLELLMIELFIIGCFCIAAFLTYKA